MATNTASCSGIDGNKNGDVQENAPRKTAMVTEVYSTRSRIVGCMTDKDGNCYYIRRNYTVNGRKEATPLKIGDVFVVDVNRAQADQYHKSPCVHDLTRSSLEQLDRYARILRGSGEENGKKVFVEGLQLVFEPTPVVLNFVVPEGVPFIGGIQFELIKRRNETTGKPLLRSYFCRTSEDIDFYKCPWPVTKANLWRDEAKYKKMPYFQGQKEYIHVFAKCFSEPEKALFEPKKGTWIRLWQNSDERHAQCASLFKLPPGNIESGKWYTVKVIKSWCSNEWIEIKSDVCEAPLPDEVDEYSTRMNNYADPRFRGFNF